MKLFAYFKTFPCFLEVLSSDTNTSSSLQANFPEAKARRFIKKDSTILNTVKVDFRSHKDMEAAVRDGLFLNDQFFRAYEFKEEVKIPIVRCYNCQNFGHIDETCRSPPKCSNCSGPLNYTAQVSATTRKIENVRIVNQITMLMTPTVKHI